VAIKAVVMSVRESIEHEIEAIRRLDPRLADGPYAQIALALADEMDGDRNKGMTKAAVGTELRQTLNRLYELIPEDQEKDAVDELRNRRENRRAGGAAA
jgi:hypothetical protein